jgi:hypothetical protein
MIKVTKKLLNTSLALLLALGLGGCAATNQAYTHKTSNEPTSAKTVKQSTAQHKAATKESKQATKKSAKAESTSAASESSNATSSTGAPVSSTTAPSQGTTTSQQPAATNQATQAATTNTYQQNNAGSTAAATSQAPAAATTTPKTTTPATTNQQQGEIQLGLGDVAVWTDSYGITHHVDSDGMDRQTIAGSTQVNYEDWSGSLPADAQVIHNGDEQHEEIQLGLGDVAVWTDSYGITHHVDSDGMDRQTIDGSSEIHYEDWYGSLPTNAQVIHNETSIGN